MPGRRRLRFDDLTAYSLLTTAPGSAIHEVIARNLRDRRASTSNDHVLTSHQTVVAMAAAGLGVGLLPERTLSMIDRNKVEIVEVIDPEITLDIGILRRKGGTSSAAVAAFLDLWLKPSANKRPKRQRLNR